jgi:hypothetical protein
MASIRVRKETVRKLRILCPHGVRLSDYVAELVENEIVVQECYAVS